MLPVTLPFNPGQIEFQGALPGVGGVQGLITSLQNNAAPVLGNWQYNALSNASGQTLTVQQVMGGIFVRSGAAGISDTLPTAAAIFANWPGAAIGSTFPLIYVNLNSGTMTLVTGSGITLAGTTTVVTVAARVYLCSITACPVNIIGLAYANGVVTITTNSPHGLASGGTAVVANTINSAFSGSFTIASVPNAYQLTYALSAATAFATDPRIPAPSAQAPALLNTTVAMGWQGCFAWPATMIA